MITIVPIIGLESNMMNTLESYRSELEIRRSSVSWNYIQAQHQTCGVNGKDDWASSNYNSGYFFL